MTTSVEPDRSVRVLGRFMTIPATHLTAGAARAIAFLAVSDGRAVRDEVAEALWPFTTPQQSRTNLRKCLWQVPRGWVDASGQDLELTATFDLQEAKRSAGLALSGAQLDFLDIELLSSDILPGWYDEWLLPFRESFRSLRVAALEASCALLIEAGRAMLAVRAGEAALRAEPLRESVAATLVAAHLAQGNRFAAAQLVRDFGRRLNSELGVAPSAELTSTIDGILGSPLA